ncbi:MAG: hypothetical protein R3264_04090 [Anaerolineae bacterium]|nr:hypothetical protein [Anaerolineae bacterium]
MDMQAVVKAAGVGVAVLIVLTLIALIPCVGCLSIPLTLVAYVGIGVLAVQWMTLPRTPGSGATNGAIAAGVAAFATGIISGIINGIRFSASGVDPFAQAVANLPPEQLAAMQEAGIDPAALAGFGFAGIFGIAAFCCVIWLVVAAALGAGGGYFWANRNPG